MDKRKTYKSTSSKAKENQNADETSEETIISIHDSDSSDEDSSDREYDDDMKVCVHCKKCFISNSDLIPHYVNSHLCEPSCFKLCRVELYERHNSLKSYQSLGFNIYNLATKLKLKKCSDCSQLFVCHFDLLAHSLHKHGNSNPYKCITCDKKCSTLWNQMQHITKTHGVKQITCKGCGKKFNKESKIVEHITLCDLNFEMYQKQKTYSRLVEIEKVSFIEEHKRKNQSPEDDRIEKGKKRKISKLATSCMKQKPNDSEECTTSDVVSVEKIKNPESSRQLPRKCKIQKDLSSSAVVIKIEAEDFEVI